MTSTLGNYSCHRSGIIIVADHKAAMLALNEGFERLKGLEKWFVIVRPQALCSTS